MNRLAGRWVLEVASAAVQEEPGEESSEIASIVKKKNNPWQYLHGAFLSDSYILHTSRVIE